MLAAAQAGKPSAGAAVHGLLRPPVRVARATLRGPRSPLDRRLPRVRETAAPILRAGAALELMAPLPVEDEQAERDQEQRAPDDADQAGRRESYRKVGWASVP